MSDLAINVVVNASQVQSGMAQVNSTVTSAADKMAQQLKQAGMAANDAASAMKNLGFGAGESSAALQRVGLVSQQAAAQVQSVAAATTSVDRAAALATARIAGFATGTGMLGTALGRVAAASSSLGPILAAAFPVFAAVALLDIISKIPGVIRDATSAMAGYGEAQKKAYAELFTSNVQMMQEQVRLKIQILDLNEIGAKGPEKFAIATKNAADSARLWSLNSAELLAMQKSLNEEIKKLDPTQAIEGRAEVGQYIINLFTDAGNKLKQYRTELEEVNKALEVANRAQVELSQVGGPKAQREKSAADKEEQLKQLENWAREQERLGKEQEEAAIKRGEAERRELEETQRIDDEVAGHSADLAKKDLEAWERTLVEKTSLVREQGKAQLDQIRANAELSERDTANKSGRGGGDPAIAQQAFQAYKQEIAVIQQLITAEDALQQKLKAVGAAIDDPKVEESLRRQAELMRQMNVAWDRYASKVQQVTREQQREVQQMVNTVSADLSHGVVSWMNGQETFGRAMQQVWTKAVDSIVSNLIRAGVQMVAHAALSNAIDKSMQFSKAEAAAASTWASVSAIPVVGPFLAPPAAAAAFAGVMAFERGGMVPGSGPVPIIAHGGEQVLTPAQQRAQAGGGGGNVVNIHYNPTVHGSATASTKDMLDKHGATLTKHISRQLRRMNR